MGVPDAISIEAPFLPEEDAARLQEFIAHGEEIAEEAQRASFDHLRSVTWNGGTGPHVAWRAFAPESGWLVLDGRR
ncbi:hypothetical protein [Actinomadura sp. 7K534]|uniref:hypothetical protein n=1 Tax=Actinomadura sp. 7K534 TaxID=2530366 RepID=UPI00104568CE|nr:hypothetical protein [Actinomadura sp. 7K534]TDB94148.1 hypothetical protein E1266_17730 [Actinomadura sp. 7K534]